MSKIKEVSSFDGSAWQAAVPIGANDTNVDITTATTNPSSDTTNTLVGLTDTNVTVAAGDTGASAWTKFNRFRQRVANVLGTYATSSNLNNYIPKSDIVTTGINGDTTVPANNTTTVYSASTVYKLMTNLIGTSTVSTPPQIGPGALTIIEAMKKHCYSGVMDFTDVFTVTMPALSYSRGYFYYFGHFTDEISANNQSNSYFHGVAFISALFSVRVSASNNYVLASSAPIATLKTVSSIPVTSSFSYTDKTFTPIIPASDLYELPGAGTIDSFIPGQSSLAFKQPVNLWFKKGSNPLPLRLITDVNFVMNNGWLRLNFSYPFKIEEN